MPEGAPLWAVPLVPVAVGALALGAAMLDAVAGAVVAGRASPARQALAPLAGAARLLVQQRRITPAADLPLWRLGIAGVPVAAVLAALVIPVGGWAAADLGVGVVWFNAMEVLVWGALWLAGWGANSAMALVGGYRFVAQGLAYELPHMLTLITAALGASSLRVGGVVAAQEGLWFAVWMPVAFAVYLVSALAMSFWGPLGAPLGRDLAGGAIAELAGADRLALVAGRYALLAVTGAFAVPLFLGGGAGPLLPGWLWSLVKMAAVVALLVLARWRLPAVRMDRFMELAWMVLIPAVLLQMLAVAIVVLVR